MKQFEPEEHPDQPQLSGRNTIDSDESVLPISLLGDLTTHVEANWSSVGTQRTHLAERSQTAADVAAKIDDEAAARTKVMECLFIGCCEAVASIPREIRNPYIPDIVG
jgi:hypothetical protein